ncbi:lactate racemase n-terminal domain [Holotrichia oblita]|nr:lactate racemase n-terminal domain [Holotrichia oblita]
MTITTEDMETIASNFSKSMLNGLKAEPSSLKMLPSFIKNPTGREKGDFLAIDFGGSNVRVVKIRLDGQRGFEVLDRRSFALKDPQGFYDYTSSKTTAANLFDFIVLKIKEIAPDTKNNPLFLGLTFSFPCHQKSLTEAVLIKWTKELETAGAEGQDIAGADIASICGTGHNTCYLETNHPLTNQPMIVNMESGNFANVPQTVYDKELDKNSENPGGQLLEKLCSGHYLGEILRLVIKDRLGGVSVPYDLKGEDLALLVVENKCTDSKIKEILTTKLGFEALADQDLICIRQTAVMIIKRSARLVAATFMGTLKTIDSKLVKSHVIAIDGSLYEKMPGYSLFVREALDELLKEKECQVSLPQEKIIEEIEGRSAPAIKDIPGAVKEALNNPIDSPPLKEVVNPGDKTVIIVSDITRAWGRFDKFLPTLLDELNQAGIPDQDIEIIIALGNHRTHTPAEDKITCGQEVCERVKIYHHNSKDSEKLVYTGTTSRGTECYLNKKVAEADKIILTGMISYHLMAGFAGGRKAIIPGVSANSTIQANHRFTLDPEVGKKINPLVGLGKLSGNSMHEDMMEATAFAKPSFLLNAVYNPDGDFTRFVAGNWEKAWESGVKTTRDIFGVSIKAKADLVITSGGGFPKDINLYQGLKAIENAYMAANQGGVIIAFLECRDINEPPEFIDWFKFSSHLEHEKALREYFTVPGFIAFKGVLMAAECSIIVITKPENADFINKTGMLAASSFEEALSIAEKKLKEKFPKNEYTISVMPSGCNTVPVLEK